MTIRVAVELTAFKEILDHSPNSAAFVIKYGMLLDELSAIVNDPTLDPTQVAILSGMVGSRQLRGLEMADLHCRSQGVLSDTKPDYLPLSVCCAGKLVIDINISPSDMLILVANNVVATNSAATNFVALAMASHTRVINSWSFFDGGTETPAGTIAPSFLHAKNIVIYDKYFGAASMRAFQETLAHAFSLYGPLSVDILILCGKGLKTIAEADVHSALTPYLDSPTRLSISKSERLASGLLDTHDRYVQLDDRRTLVFPTGTGVFYEWGGALNRAGQIFEVDISDTYTVAEILRTTDGSVVKVKF